MVMCAGSMTLAAVLAAALLAVAFTPCSARLLQSDMVPVASFHSHSAAMRVELQPQKVHVIQAARRKLSQSTGVVYNSNTQPTTPVMYPDNEISRQIK